jgi:hypothetical protein
MCLANSTIIVLLFDALSQVMCLIYINKVVRLLVNEYGPIYLVSNPNPVNNLEQCLTEAYSVVRIVELRETEESHLNFPLPISLFNPGASYSKICIAI